VPDVGSSVPRRQLGRYLREAREAAGISIDAAAIELQWSRAKIYRIERGQQPVRRYDAKAMCDAYGADARLTEALTALATETTHKGWWHSYGEAVPEWFELYVGLEAAAERIRAYEPTFVPGLLQTPAYAGSVIRTTPSIGNEAEVGRAVAVRIERQRLLTRHRPAPPGLEVIIDEAVLRRPIGDREEMQHQLAHLAATNGPRITVRVLPLRAGPNQALTAGAFAILEFQDGPRSEPTTVYSEGLTGALYLDKPPEIARYDRAWSTLDRAALDVKASRDLIMTIIREVNADA
jgi:transcriptional regulator with XRE-family HTH domain